MEARIKEKETSINGIIEMQISTSPDEILKTSQINVFVKAILLFLFL